MSRKKVPVCGPAVTGIEIRCSVFVSDCRGRGGLRSLATHDLSALTSVHTRTSNLVLSV